MPLDFPDPPRRPKQPKKSSGGGSSKPPRRTVGMAFFLFFGIPAIVVGYVITYYAVLKPT